MGDEIEKRITQMKMVMEENKSKNYLKLEELRYEHTMEALKFMAKHNITSFSLSLSDRQLSRLSKSLSTFPEKEKRHNNDLTKICFNYACEDLDKSKDRCKRDKVCDMQIRKSSLES